MLLSFKRDARGGPDSDDDGVISMTAEKDGDSWVVRLPDGSEHRIHVDRQPDDVLKIAVECAATGVSRTYRAPFARSEDGVEVAVGSNSYLFAPESDVSGPRKGKASSGSLTAPMVGLVSEVLVREGEQVAAYQALVTIEAMKVVATIEAPFAGVVEKVYVCAKDQVAHGAQVVDIRAVEAAAPTQ